MLRVLSELHFTCDQSCSSRCDSSLAAAADEIRVMPAVAGAGRYFVYVQPPGRPPVPAAGPARRRTPSKADASLATQSRWACSLWAGALRVSTTLCCCADRGLRRLPWAKIRQSACRAETTESTNAFEDDAHVKASQLNITDEESEWTQRYCWAPPGPSPLPAAKLLTSASSACCGWRGHQAAARACSCVQTALCEQLAAVRGLLPAQARDVHCDGGGV